MRPSVIFIDIDKFKSVNVSFGLVVGDSLLLTVARRLQSHLGPHDTLARVGGDQFAILLVSEQSPQDLAGLAERVRRSLRAPIKIAGQEIVLTGSIGIAVYDGETPSHLDLYKEAEIAMYRAKRGGADRIEIFRPEMRSDRDDRVALESDLRKALAKNQIKVLYQPIIYLPTEELAGFEALVRWEHPKRGLMSPVDFIPIAEQSDLIVRLGSHVLLRAAHEAARWQRELPREERPLFVSVNISSRQIFRQNLIQEIRHILGRNIVPKGSLRLEITESLVMENPEQATEILEWLRGAGAELALDDFGTGYSSLAYLQRFPFDTIKIDRALVQASGESGGAGSAIVRSIVALGHELGKNVVAEGVETPEDVGFLRSINCQYAQGFYYGEPMSDRDVLQLLKMVRTAEHKLRPRGLFRAKAKGKQRDKKVAGSRAAAAKTNGATPHRRRIRPNGRPPAPPSTLPNSTVRPRLRLAPAAAGAAGPTPAASAYASRRDGAGRLRHACRRDAARLRCSRRTPSSIRPCRPSTRVRLAAARVCATAATAVRGRAAWPLRRRPVNLRSRSKGRRHRRRWTSSACRRSISRSRRHRRTLHRRIRTQGTARIRRSTDSTSCRRRCRRRWASARHAARASPRGRSSQIRSSRHWRRIRCRRSSPPPPQQPLFAPMPPRAPRSSPSAAQRPNGVRQRGVQRRRKRCEAGRAPDCARLLRIAAGHGREPRQARRRAVAAASRRG